MLPGNNSLLAGHAPPGGVGHQQPGSGLFAPVSGPGLIQSVEGCFRVSGTNQLVPLQGQVPTIPSPADSNIKPDATDDVTAPNATTAERCNRVVCSVSANVGYSEAAKDTNVPPSALAYDIEIVEGLSGKFAMSVRMILQFNSSFPQEGMVVWLKKHQQLINDSGTAELTLVETAFEDWNGSSWTPISADVRYAEEAEAIVQAVITTDSGQTAGRVKSEGAVEDAKLGPVGEKGRVILTYYCNEAYSYAEMSLGQFSEDRRLVPVGVQLPWAPLDNPANNCPVEVRVTAPQNSRLLDVDSNILAYQDFAKSLPCDSLQGTLGMFGGGPSTSQKTVVIVPDQSQSTHGWQFVTQHLPPRPSLVLFWVSVADPASGWEFLDANPCPQTSVELKKPSDADAALLQAHLPGGQTGHLLRCQVNTEAPGRKEGSVRVHTDITITDASGSTGMMVQGTKVRSLFNQHEERRILTRLDAIPKIAAAGILLPNDVWRQHFVVFDHGVRDEFLLECKVGDLDTTTVALLTQALKDPFTNAAALAQLTHNGKQALLASWQSAFAKLRGLTPGGTTSFAAGANRAKGAYTSSVPSMLPSRPEVGYTSYVNFDTDGGNNTGECYGAIRSLVQECNVVQGSVLGIGSWVDQHCASEVAKILKGPANLSLSFPQDAAADTHFRQDLSRWIKALRTCPVSLTVSAGATTWNARQGQRFENGVDVLFAAGEGLKFGAPDVSEMTHSKSKIEGLNAGESVVLYLLSRRPLAELATGLTVDVNGVVARVSTGCESMRGITLANDWLSFLGRQKMENIAENKSCLCDRLRSRLEDDISFNWNVPTKSGSTAAIGRSKTETRKPVPASQQPDEPTVPKTYVETLDASRTCLFGGPAPMAAFGAPGAPPASAAACSFGGAPAGGAFGAMGGWGGGTGPQMKQANAPMGGTWGGAPMGGTWGAAPMGGKGGSGGGMGGGLFGAAPMAQQQQQSLGGPPVFGSGGKGYSKGGYHPYESDAQPEVQGPKPPSKLLAATGSMRWGPQETDPTLKRTVTALKVLASSEATANVQAGTAGTLGEDPLVASLLGAPLPTSGAVHHGYTCDATHTIPIKGVRFKAANALDADLCIEARRLGKFAGFSGFIPLPDPAAAMRMALGAILCWWRLVWPDRQDLFANPVNLSLLSEQEMRQAIMRLPEA